MLKAPFLLEQIRPGASTYTNNKDKYMTHENLFKIHIPEPFHEDWDKMTPNVQGAFCKSCSKTVIDFSGKSNGEVNAILAANADTKICGRFKSSQLAESPRLKNEIPQVKIQKIEFPGYLFPINYSPLRAYALAFFAVAALTMAGCSESKGEMQLEDTEDNTEQVVGKMSYNIDVNSNQNITNVPYSTCNNVNINYNVMGGLTVQPPKDTALKIDTSESMIMLGEVVAKVDTVKPPKEKILKGDVQFEK